MIAINVLSDMAHERSLHVDLADCANEEAATLVILKSMEDVPLGESSFSAGRDVRLGPRSIDAHPRPTYVFQFLNKYPKSN